MEPINTRVRLLELVNAVRRLPNTSASEQVRRATVALAEAMQVDGLTAASVRGEHTEERAPAPTVRARLLPDALATRIEQTRVRWREQDHRLRITRVVPYPPPPLNRIALDVTVRTRTSGRTIEVTCRLRPSQLQAEDETSDRIIGVVRSALEGEVAPAAIVVL